VRTPGVPGSTASWQASPSLTRGLRTFGDAVPYDVEGDDVDRAGRLAELIARLQTIAADLGRAQPIDAWCEGIQRAVDLLTVVPDRDAWQRQQLERELAEVLGSATAPDGTVTATELELAEIRTLFAERLRGKPSRANHRTGDLTVCTLVPMRSVPHRVVCLLGMDDMAFPRTTQIDGDSLLDAAPRVGDRDPRTEDRQLLLDAVLAATDALVVTYTGRDERTNEPEPPSVPIGELLDTIDATVVPADPQRTRAREVVVVEHPLQGFDPRNFEAGRLGMSGVWGFERTDLAGARALRSPRESVGRFVSQPLPPLDEPIVALDDLTAFLGHPVRAFLSRRLGVRVPRDQDERDDAIPVEAAPLVKYSIGQRRLDAALQGADPARWEAVERARGELPPGNLADPVLAEVHETVAALMAAAVERGAVAGTGPAVGRTVEIDVPLAGGRALVGTVRGAHDDVVSALRYANLGPRHHLEAYVQLVALSAAHPDRPWRAVAIGRNRKKAKAKAAWCQLGPLGGSVDERQEVAMRGLEGLLDLYDRGLTEPLPLYCKTSAAYAEAVSGAKPNRFQAAGMWDDEWGFPENADPEHVVVLGSSATYESLLLEPPSGVECGAGWADVASRFEALALRLWQPIMACREEGTA
jgi:exodeoxyribonuclease V gamma subunit